MIASWWMIFPLSLGKLVQNKSNLASEQAQCELMQIGANKCNRRGIRIFLRINDSQTLQLLHIASPCPFKERKRWIDVFRIPALESLEFFLLQRFLVSSMISWKEWQF